MMIPHMPHVPVPMTVGGHDVLGITALREELSRVLRLPSDGAPLVAKGWPLRYAARRIAWHVLDHTWEMEDRSEPG